MSKKISFTMIAVLFYCGSLAQAESKKTLNPEHFPVGEEVRRRADFWVKVYTEINSDEAFIHDSDDLTFVYKKVAYKNYTSRAKRKFLQDEKKAIKSRLLKIAEALKKQTELSEEEQSFHKQIGKPSAARLHEMSLNIRHQQGMRDRYYEGLVRSQKYIQQIREIFAEMQLPDELSYLPHVESSFNYLAYSKVGAAGMWQFMRSSARVYRMKMNYAVDERRDPIISTRAAARHLIDNYRKLGTWPLAVTAYNHGPASIERAVRTVGSKSMDDIIHNYQGKRFGFASKNFYATFVATVEVSMQAEKYFKDIPQPDAFKYVEVPLPKALTLQQISKWTGFDKETLQEYNPALRPIVFRSQYQLSKGMKINLPESFSSQLASLDEKTIPVIETPEINIAEKSTEAPTSANVEPAPLGEHIVAPGESLYLISKLYSVNLADLMTANPQVKKGRIQPQMKLNIPSAALSTVVAAKPAPIVDESKRVAVVDKKTLIPISPLPKGNHFPIANPSAAAPLAQPSAAANTAVTEVASVETLKPGFFQRLFGKTPEDSSKTKNSDRSTQNPEMSSAADAHQAEPNVTLAAYDLEVVALGGDYFRVTVEAEETLGHLAEWASTRAQKIRDWNRLSYQQHIALGKSLKIKLSPEQLAKFNRERAQYHQAIEEDFFDTYKLNGTTEYLVKKGDTIEGMVEELEIPMWLIRRFQGNQGSRQLSVGQKIKLPIVVAKSGEAQEVVHENSPESTAPPAEKLPSDAKK